MALDQSMKEYAHQTLDEHIGKKIEHFIEINDRENLNILKDRLLSIFNSENNILYQLGEEGKSYLENMITEYITKIDDFLNK